MRPTHEGTFHVTARSINHEHIFRDDGDYIAGITIVASLVAEGFLDCHGFCFMPTHYHLIGSFQDGMLTPAIRRLHRRYSSDFNRKHGRHGHVFNSPFRSIEITRESYADYLPIYITENPPWHPWPWSSYDTEFSFVVPLPWDEEFGVHSDSA
jgi:REP element-mobilizing transposase RayT